MKYTGKIVKEPIVTENKITTAIKMPNGQKPVQVVTFPKHRDAETVNNMSAFKVGDEVIIYGKQEANPKTKELQIIVNKAYNAVKNNNAYVQSSDDIYSINPAVDFIVGGLSSNNNKPISMSEPREGRRQYYTDGDFYWYKDHSGIPGKVPTSF